MTEPLRAPKRPPELPPAPATLPPAPAALAATVEWEAVRDAFVVGEETGGADASSGQALRRYPALREIAARFSINFDTLEARARVDGWESRRTLFQSDLEQSRQRLIIERISSQDANSRLAYLGIHNDLIRGLGRLIQAGIPTDKPANGPGCTFAPRELKTIADTTLACSDIMAAAQGRAKGSESAFTLAVQIAQAQSLRVPVPSLSVAQNEGLVPVDPGAKGAGIQSNSLWSVLIEARRGTPPPDDPYDAPSPLPLGLSSVPAR